MVLKITGLGGSDCLYIRAADYLHHCYTCKMDKQACWKAATVCQLPLGVRSYQFPATIWNAIFQWQKTKQAGIRIFSFAPTFYKKLEL